MAKIPFKVMTAGALVALLTVTAPIGVALAAKGDFYNQTTKTRYAKEDLKNNPELLKQLQEEEKNGNVIIKEIKDNVFVDYTKTNESIGSSIGAGKTPLDAVLEAITNKNNKIEGDAAKELGGYETANSKIVVKSVEASTTSVDENANKQMLGFTVNKGKKVTLAELTEAGYSIEFQVSKDVLEGDVTPDFKSSTGELDESKLIAGEDFSYKIVVSKANEKVAESELVKVTIADFSALTTEITKVELAIDDSTDDVIISSGKVVVGEPVIVVTGEGTLKDGTKDADILSNFTYKSSDVTKAVVNASGVITPISAGNVTITVKDGDVTKDILLTVVEGDRVATKATFDKEAVRVINGGSQVVTATIVDQYGDPIKDVTASAINVKNSKNESILTATPTATAATGKVNITFTGDSNNLGKGTIELKSGNTVLGTLSAEVGTGTEVSYRKLAIAAGSKSDDYKLDVNTSHTDDSQLTVVWNKYNDSDILIGAENDAKYSVSSSKPSVATVANADLDTTGTIVVNAVAAGTTTITIKEGAITKASFDVTVVDTTPVAQSINLASGVSKIEVKADASGLGFADIKSNFVVKNQFGEEFTPANEDVTFFVDDSTVLDTTTVNKISAKEGVTVGKTANLVVKVNGKVVSVPVVITDAAQ